MKIVPVLLAACLLPLQGEATVQPQRGRRQLRKQSADDNDRRRERFLQMASPPPLEALNATGVSCGLGDDHGGNLTIEIYTIKFDYALGTTASLDATQIFHLQQNIFLAVQHSIAWCSAPQTQIPANATGKRILSQQQGFVDAVRKLGILSVNAGATNTSAGSCPDSGFVNDLMNSTGAAECRLSQGTILVMAHTVDNLDYMSAVLLNAMNVALNDDQVWKNWSQDLSQVAFLSYLNGNLDDTHARASPIAGAPAGNGGSGNHLAVVLGLGVPIVLLLLLLGFVRSNKKREHMTERNYNAWMNSDYVLVGNGDPPASFHEGLYHYMRDGTRYLSTNCEGCLETRRNSFFTDDNLGTILEDAEFEENILITASPKNLGERASNMDVHTCTSSTCDRCLSSSTRCGPEFISAHRIGAATQDGVVFSEGNVEV